MCTLKDFLPRLYQQTILGTTVNNNTLVVLPTGLGKTASAFMLAVQRLNKYPESKILMLAPTKPLCEQHVESFRKYLEIDPEEIVLFTGSVSPLKRAALWQDAKIIISTPQGLENDLINKRINFAEVSLLVFDECVTKGTKISLADGKRINIEKLEEKINNEKILVNSLNEKTGCIEPAKITKFHKIKSNKKILQIKFKSQKIKATEDHLFLAEFGGKIDWVSAKKLKEGDLVATFKNSTILKKNRILVRKQDIINQFSERQRDLFEQFLEATKLRKSKGFGARKISKKLNISEGAIRNWINKPFRKPIIQNTINSLENKLLIPLTYNSPFLPIIARLFGHLFGDGWTNYDKRGNLVIGFSGSIDDLISIQSDLSLLGSKYSKINSRNTVSVANHLSGGKRKIKGVSNSFVVSDGRITKLLVSLGLPIGNKTKNLFLIPKWIMEGPCRIKKEFLSALMGSEGYTPSLKRNLKTCNPVRLSFNLIKSLENEGVAYAKQIKNLFFDFKINLQISKRVGNRRKDGLHTVKFLLTLSNSNNSMIWFLEEVNYSYAINKRIQGNYILKYLKAKESNLKERISLSEKARNLHKQGLGSHKIARKLGLKRGLVENWIYYNIKPSMIASKMSKFDLGKGNSNNLLVKWQKIEKIDVNKNEEYVYDLTVEKNHNYVANNFIVHNCHHATGDYSYVWLAEQYEKNATNKRILALTASPGATLEKIQEIYQNLFIEQVEVKSEKDPDVQPYVQKTNVNWQGLEFPKEFEKLHDELKLCAKKKVEIVKSFGFVNTKFLNKGQLLKLQGMLQHKLRQGADFEVMKALSVIAEALKVEHALELLECQGLKPAHEYLHRLVEESSNTKVKAVKNLVRDPNFKAALYWSENLIKKDLEYPKLTKLNEIVNEDLNKNPGTKIIIFTNYRNSAQEISRVLEKQAVKHQLFFGQAKKDGVGFTQKRQKEILDQFRAGEFNVLVATSVAEEGLDIPKVDRVIFYEATASAIRNIQRRGRTGRLEEGSVIVMYMKGTRDEAYRWASHHKEKSMHKILDQLKISAKQMAQKESQGFSTAANVDKAKIDLKAAVTGNQSLNNFVSENVEISDNKPVAVLADHREKDNKVVKELIDLDINVRTGQLTSADYLVSGVVGVELKKVPDFVGSLIDGRLIEQVKELKRNFEKAILIIEGEEDIFAVRKVHANAIRGALASIVLGFGVPVLYTKDSQDTAALLAVMAKREQQGDSKEYSLHTSKPQSIKEQQEYLVSAMPSIGLGTARILLEHFGSIKALVGASEEQITSVKGIGKITAKKLVNVFEKAYLTKR